MKRISVAVAAFTLAVAGASATQADPFAVTYTGTQLNSNFANILDGQSYEVTVVFDNGSATAAGQTWTAADLRCVVWRFNDARDVAFAQDPTVKAPNAVSGSAQTDASGVLTSMFSELVEGGTSTGIAQSSTAGFTTAVAWYANEANDVFFDGNYARNVGDTAGGVQMAPGNWSNPTPFSGGCLDQVNMAPPAPPAVVPTLTEWAMILLGGLLAVTAAVVVSRRRLS